MIDEKELQNKYFHKQNFINRDLSWLEFNRRVLQEALDKNLPILERVKFISIFFSNLDEFYMIRVAGLKEQVLADVIEPTIDGLTPREQLIEIQQIVNDMLDEIHSLWANEIIPELQKADIYFKAYHDLNNLEKKSVDEFFNKEIYPVLTPLAFDPGRPFPYISNLSLSIAVFIKKAGGENHFARVKIPGILPRVLRLDSILKPENGSATAQEIKYIWIDDIIKNNLTTLFPGLEIQHAHLFRLTRDTDIEIQEDEADDLLEEIQENIRRRKFGKVVRLEVEKSMPDFMLDVLIENLEITKFDLQIIDGQLGLSDVIKIYELPFHHLKEKLLHAFAFPTIEEDENIFSIIKKNDILLHHPYDSFSPVITFIKTASEDPDVLAIKQTLYRVGPNSPIIKYLIEAAERKKQVAVLVELKARFDEENNIFWARELEKSGVHVVYGLVGLKTHAKMSLVVRKEIDGVKRYVHLGTGNYNSQTAKLYTDLGFFTADQDLCADVSEVFNYLTGYSQQNNFRKLIVAPINTRQKFLHMIYREIENVRHGNKGHLIFKLNSLVDPTIISALYEASSAGVRIDLIVRGICCLIPQKNGLSDNIFVKSIVGRFLEHSRIYYFYNMGKEEIYLSSADLMQRNLDRRVETTFPIQDKEIKERIINEILKNYLKDDIKSRVLLPTGKYVFNQGINGNRAFNVQEFLMQRETPKENPTIKHREKNIS